MGDFDLPPPLDDPLPLIDGDKTPDGAEKCSDCDADDIPEALPSLTESRFRPGREKYAHRSALSMANARNVYF